MGSKVYYTDLRTHNSISLPEKLKRLIKKVEKSEMFISQLDIEPIAYILKKDNKFHIEAINEKYESFIEKNGNNLSEEEQEIIDGIKRHERYREHLNEKYGKMNMIEYSLNICFVRMSLEFIVHIL